MRTRAPPAGSMEVMEDEEEEPGPGGDLRFDEAISWTAGRAIPTAELLKRLERFAKELRPMEQQDGTREALKAPAKDLSHSNLLKHKDKGVKSWTAYCLVDVLRLAAPDAPFSSQQLKDVFTLFVSHSISSLADPSDAYHTQNYYVLQQLLTTKAVALLTDLPSAKGLIIELFTVCFDILCQPSDNLNRNLEYNLTGVLQTIVDECANLPTEAVDIVLAQFLHADPGSSQSIPSRAKRRGIKEVPDPTQSRLALKRVPSAYKAAQSVCNTCDDQMSRHVGQYFNNVILDASGASSRPIPKHRGRHDMDEDEEEQAPGPSKEGVEQLEKAHKLLREMWKACPSVLQGVIPQIEAELSADNVDLRRLATEAFGDMIAGIGVEAQLAPPVLDPAKYPPLSLSAEAVPKETQTDSSLPKATQSLAQTHLSAYQSFISRRNDKAAEVRSAWTTSIGRVLSTSAGGVGLSPQEQRELFEHLSNKLTDPDEKVRIAAVKAFTLLDFRGFVSLLEAAPMGASSKTDVLTDKVKDISSIVRSDAAHFLGNLWGVAAQEVADENDSVTEIIGPIPSKILNGAYLNRADVNALIEQVVFESLIPLSYPIVKRKEKHALANGDTKELSDAEADMIRAERLLLLYKQLDPKAKAALLAILARPSSLSKFTKAFIKACDDFNGGVMDHNEKEIKSTLRGCIDMFVKMMPDSSRASEDLWRFAKINDRRSYALIRFCAADESDYKKIFRSMKELNKRLEASAAGSATLKDTMTALLYKTSHLFYNKSHVRPIMQISCQEGHSLATAAHELLRDISSRAPGIFKAHGRELCELVQSNAPSDTRTNDPGSIDALKACASFASRYPRDVPKDKAFYQAMMRYIVRGSPPSAAKYAVSVVMLSSEKKDMHAKEILKLCVDGFAYGSNDFIVKLAGLSQLMLLKAHEMDEEKEIDPVLHIAIKQTLSRSTPSSLAPDSGEALQAIEARCWALKIIVNRLRSYPNAEAIKDIRDPVYQLLNKYVADQSDPPTKNPTFNQVLRSRLRLQAALLHLKLATHSDFDTLLTPFTFNSLLLVAQDTLLATREAFINKVKKYLNQDRLPSRFYNVIFLLAFEPTKAFKYNTTLWLRARAATLSKRKKTTLELCLARFLSAIVHHPDFSREAEDLDDLISYLVFYLQSVATASNISLIYHVAQRVKTVQDGIDVSKSQDLYYASELACNVINAYAGVQNWSIEAIPGTEKIHMPAGVFARMKDHRQAQDVADTQYMDQEAAEGVEGLVRAKLKASKKRKSVADGDAETKRRAGGVGEKYTNGANLTRPKKATAVKKGGPGRSGRTPKKGVRTEGSDDDEVAVPSSDNPARRKSSRAKGRKSYAEDEDEDEDVEMGDAEEEEISPRSDKENRKLVGAG